MIRLVGSNPTLIAKFKIMFIGYYIICLIYCFARSAKKWEEQDLGANSMEFMMIMTIGWILAPIDFSIISYKHYHTKK
jgi:hypothetical protein